MKVASYTRTGERLYGVIVDENLRAASRAFRARYPDLKSVLAADALYALAEDTKNGAVDDFDQVRFDPAIDSPGRIICVGMNYKAHIREMGRETPEHPALFIRFADSLVGHREPVIRPRVSTKFDFEGELAVIIGQPARHVSAANALGHVGGYTCLMEGTIRDYQMHTTQFTAGKNFTASGSCGPWLVTTDEIPDPGTMSLQTRVNGEVMQTGEISDLCIGIERMIEYLSGIFELRSGDIIATGTPAGVGAARKPPRWLAPGDTVEVEISGIGTLRNTVADES